MSGFLAVSVRDIGRDDKHVARQRGKAVRLDKVRPRALRHDVDFVEVVRVHQERKIVFVNVDGGEDLLRGVSLAGDAETRVQCLFKGIKIPVGRCRFHNKSSICAAMRAVKYDYPILT